MRLLAGPVVFLHLVAVAVAVGKVGDGGRQQGDSLAVGETVRVEVKTRGDPTVRFLLCGRTNCGNIFMRGVTADGRINFQSWTNADLFGNGGQKTVDVEDDGVVNFLPGDNTYIFVVRRGASNEFSVWLESHPERVARVAVNPEFNRLIVRNRWSGTIWTQFVEGSKDRKPGDRLAVGDKAMVRVSAEGDAYARFQFCGDTKCSKVVLLGITPDSSISYWTLTDTDKDGYTGKFVGNGDLFVRFPTGDHLFVVQRTSEKEAAVWLASRPDRVAKVLIHPDSDRLTVKDPWRETVKVQFLNSWAAEKQHGHGDGTPPLTRQQGDTLAVGETVRVRVATRGDPTVRFLLCGRYSCGNIWIRGLTSDGRMDFQTWTNTNLFGNGGQRIIDEDLGVTFPVGDHTFLVKRSTPSDFSVWLNKKPERVARVTVDPEFTHLIIRNRWSGTVRPQFVDSSKSRKQGERLAVGQKAFVRVSAEGDAYARFQFCGSKCSKVDVLGITNDKRISYWTFTDADEEGFTGRMSSNGDLFVPFPAGDHSFVVERKSEQEAAVWLASKPDRVATVQLHSGSDRLTVKDPWKDTVKVQYLNVCGKAKGGPSELVLNGEATSIESVPWHVAIFVERDGKLANVCGGTLVSSCSIVTAAHCIPKDEKMFVALGKTLSGWDADEGYDVHKTKVKKVHKHPYYKGFISKLVYDIALLEMENCAKLGDKIFPICLDNSIKPATAADIKVAGWGNESTVLLELESVHLSQLSFEDCFKVMDSNAQQLGFITHDKFCAKRKENSALVGLLQGDSGGGALVKRDGSWFLAGVVSVRLQTRKRDDDVFALTDVSQYVDWISSLANWRR